MSKKLIGILDTKPELREDGCVTCADGFNYNLFNFTKEMVNLDFIVNSLSKIARYTGHNTDNRAYTVAQHSVIMAETALLAYGDVDLAIACLWHDASEAYTGDIVRPLKNTINDMGFKKIEHEIEETIFHMLNIKFPFDKRVKEIDANICVYELTTLLNKSDLWDIWDCYKSMDMFYKTITKLKVMKQQREMFISKQSEK